MCTLLPRHLNSDSFILQAHFIAYHTNEWIKRFVHQCRVVDSEKHNSPVN